MSGTKIAVSSSTNCTKLRVPVGHASLMIDIPRMYAYIRTYTSCKLQSYVLPAVKPARTFTHRRGSFSYSCASFRKSLRCSARYFRIMTLSFLPVLPSSLRFSSLFPFSLPPFSIPVDDDTDSPTLS